MFKIVCYTFFSFFLGQWSAVAQSPGVVVQRHLALKSMKTGEYLLIDTSNHVSITCKPLKDSVQTLHTRELSGTIVQYTDSSMTVAVNEEMVTRRCLDGNVSFDYYNIQEDSAKNYSVTLLFSELYALSNHSHDKRQTARFFQSASYLLVSSFFATVALSMLRNKSYDNYSSGGGIVLSLGGGMVLGGTSYLFYPKNFVLGTHGKKQRSVKWKIVVL